MARLPNGVKRLIIQRLATYTSATDIQRELKELGLELSLKQIGYYNPETQTDLAKEWRELFTSTRAAFKKDTSSIAIAQKSFRLRELDRMYRNAMLAARPNIPLAKELLVEAEKFTGEAYTNRRVITSGDSLADLAKILGFTPEQLATLIAMEEDGEGAAPGMGVTH